MQRCCLSPALGTCTRAQGIPQVLQGHLLLGWPRCPPEPAGARRVPLAVCQSSSWAQPWWQGSPALMAERQRAATSPQQYPKTMAACISFTHLENLIPLLDICHNAVLPALSTHVEFYSTLNTNYFRSSCSNLCPKGCNNGIGAKPRLRLGDCYRSGFIINCLVSVPLDPQCSALD